MAARRGPPPDAPQIFKPGNKAAVGNRGNRNRLIVTQTLVSILNEIDPATEKPKLYTIADALVKNAMKGDNVAFKEIAERVEGKVKQTIDGKLDVVYDLSKLTDAELEAFERIARKVAVIDGDTSGEGQTSH